MTSNSIEPVSSPSGKLARVGLSDTCEEAPVFSERTSVGLDVHARSVVAAAIDGQTGEVFKARLTPSHEEVLEGSASCPVRARSSTSPGRPDSAWPAP
jgi:hypothetical protein